MTDVEGPWVVRLWDGFDGEWMDVSDPIADRAEADTLCGDKNEARASGKREGSYGDIDYYKVFPADTVMFFSEKGGHAQR